MYSLSLPFLRLLGRAVFSSFAGSLSGTTGHQLRTLTDKPGSQWSHSSHFSPPRIEIEPFPRLLNRLRVQSQHTSQRGTWGLEHYHQPASSRILRRMSLIETRGQQNNAPPQKKVHILFPGTGKHVGLHGKGELWVQMELMFQDLVMGRLSRWVQCYHKDPYKWKGKAEKLGLWSSLVA